MVYAYLFLIGLAAGSFVNVLIYRLPRREAILWGRSCCPHCRRVIKWFDLIPIVSFFLLGGKCRHCRQSISWRYPLVELYSGIVFVLAWRAIGQLSQAGLIDFLFFIFLIETFLVLFWTDLLHLILPDAVMIWATIVVVGYGFLEKLDLGRISFQILSLGHLLSVLLFASVFGFVWFVSKGKWLGLGDVKLVGLIGLIFGFVGGSFVLYSAVIIGGLTGLLLFLARWADGKTKLPLGSFISLGATVYLFTGLRLIYALNLDRIFR